MTVLSPLRSMAVGALLICPSMALASDPPATAAATLVLATQVHVSSEERFGPFIGSVEPRYETDLGFQVSGRIIARNVHVGDRVEAGETLARIDATLLQLSVRSAEADVANAEAQLANAKVMENRDSTLIASRAIAQATLDDATATRQTAEAKLTQAQTALRQAQDQLNYATLKASYDGIVTAVDGEVGNTVSAGQSVVTIARPDIREAVVNIPDHLIAGLSQEGAFTVSLAGNPSIATKASVRLVAPLADGITRTREVRLSLQDPPVAFRLGSIIEAVSARPVSPRAVVPASAIMKDQDGAAVWVIDSATHTLQRKPVTVLADDASGGVTIEGLADGDRVVTAGIHSLKAGEKVRFAEDRP